MKCIKTNPCKECPFRTESVKGWLGDDTAVEVIQKVHGEGGYVCHMSIADGQMERARQCTGAMLHANMTCKLYNNPALRVLQEKMKSLAGKFRILGYNEFLERHKNSFVEALRDRKVLHGHVFGRKK